MSDIQISQLRERVQIFVSTMGIRKNIFAKNVNIGRTTLFMWLAGKYNLTDTDTERIDTYLRRFGF